MNRRICILSTVAVLFLALTGCGDDGEAAKTKASDFNGTWTGTYALSGEQSKDGVPFTLHELSGTDEDGVVAGYLESEYLTGAFAGTLEASGSVVGEVASEVDGTTWTAVAELVDGGIFVDFTNEVLSATGEGAVAAPANKIGYKYTFVNKSEVEVDVDLWVRELGATFSKGVAHIMPNEEFTYETGLKCAMGVSGWSAMLITGSFQYFPDMSAWGKVKDQKNWFWPFCASATWWILPDQTGDWDVELQKQ